MKHRFTKAEIQGMAEELLKAGMHPRRVRQELSKRGLHWEYQFFGQGRGERTRRLRQQGLALCRCGQGTYTIANADPLTNIALCPSCLDAKWRNQTIPNSLPDSHRTDSGLILP